MTDDATARAMTGDIVPARENGGKDDVTGVGQGIVVIAIAIGGIEIGMDGERETGKGALAETDITTDEVRIHIFCFLSYLVS